LRASVRGDSEVQVVELVKVQSDRMDDFGIYMYEYLQFWTRYTMYVLSAMYQINNHLSE
jgi:hypothetical protein